MANTWEEFPPVSAQEWKAAIVKELKGTSYDTIRWESPEQIVVEPFYSKENTDNLLLPASQAWKVAEYIKVLDISTANKNALKALEGGAEVILFDLENTFIGPGDLNKLQENIIVDIAPVYFLNRKGGNEYVICNLQPSHYSGNNMVDQLAEGLSQAHEHLVSFIDQGEPADQAVNKIHFLVSCGNRYLFEICKIRALRWLWTSLAKQYGADVSDISIIAESSTLHFSQAEPYDNMIRNTAQVMSAVLGGATMIYSHPHNGQADPGFGVRIARNIQLLLKEEAYMHNILNSVDGAWFFDNITRQLAEKAWDKFRTR